MDAIGRRVLSHMHDPDQLYLWSMPHQINSEIPLSYHPNDRHLLHGISGSRWYECCQFRIYISQAPIGFIMFLIGYITESTHLIKIWICHL